MTRAVLCLVAALSSGATAAPREAQPERDWPAGFRIDRFEWQRDLAPGGSVSVENPWGDVHARLNGVPRLDVFAVIQSEERDPEKAEVEIASGAGGLRVAVRYGAGRSGVPERPPVRRVDLTVFVPAGSRLRVETGGGAIDVRGLQSDVTATAAAGEIAVATTGSIAATTASGDIRARLGEGPWGEPPRFETRTGSIDVRFPPGAAALVRASTQGEVTSEAPIEMETGAAGATAVIGEGGPTIRMESLEGDIRIRSSR